MNTDRKPVAGDVYAVWHRGLRGYAACQITHCTGKNGRSEQYVVLELDWTGTELPGKSELESMKPLVCNYYFWNDRLDHSHINGPVPPNYIHAGWREPLVGELPNSYAAWRTGGSRYSQLRWEQIPAEARTAFKAAARSQERVRGDGWELSRSNNRLSADWLEQLDDIAVLDELPCLTTVSVRKPDSRLMDYIVRHPFIYDLTIEEPPAELDLRGSGVSKLALNVREVRSLYLSDESERLTLSDAPHSGLEIVHEHRGAGLTLALHGAAVEALDQFHGLDDLEGLELSSVKDVDVGRIADRFPRLRSLRIWGKPGYLHGEARLRDFGQMEMFTVMDLFGFTGETFPVPQEWPNLQSLWLNSIPAEAAAVVKTAYKTAAKQGLDLSVRQPRKPEWLAENLDNPFRDWDGREGITANQAKKAAAFYKKTRAALREIAADAENGLESAEATGEQGEEQAPKQIREQMQRQIQERLAGEIAAYVQAFNKLDSRSGFIYTEEREDIYMALKPLLEQTAAQLLERGLTVDMGALWERFDAERDF